MDSGEVRIGKACFSIEVLRNVTEEEAINMHKNHPILKEDDIRKAWKVCNGLSKPNHLANQLEGIKPNRQAKKKKTK